MATQKGARGARGIPGPPGPAGKQGLAGATGTKGATGATGKQGVHGKKGATGRTEGSIGGRSRVSLIADIDQHVENIYSELSKQLKRTAKIQTELDDLRAKVRHLLGT